MSPSVPAADSESTTKETQFVADSLYRSASSRIGAAQYHCSSAASPGAASVMSDGNAALIRASAQDNTAAVSTNTAPFSRGNSLGSHRSASARLGYKWVKIGIPAGLSS